MKAVIFDFDGLILDTETPLFESWRETYAEHGLELTLEQWSANVGGCGYREFHPYRSLEEGYGRPRDWDAVHKTRLDAFRARLAEMDCIDGVRDTIAAAEQAGLKLAVASSSDAVWVHAHLKRLGLFDRFEVISCGDQVGAIKPDPAVYLRALEQLGVAAPEAFAFEDSLTGVAAAQAAGIRVIAVPNPVTAPLDFSHAERRLAYIHETPFAALLNELRAEQVHAL